MFKHSFLMIAVLLCSILSVPAAFASSITFETGGKSIDTEVLTEVIRGKLDDVKRLAVNDALQAVSEKRPYDIALQDLMQSVGDELTAFDSSTPFATDRLISAVLRYGVVCITRDYFYEDIVHILEISSDKKLIDEFKLEDRAVEDVKKSIADSMIYLSYYDLFAEPGEKEGAFIAIKELGYKKKDDAELRLVLENYDVTYKKVKNAVRYFVDYGKKFEDSTLNSAMSSEDLRSGLKIIKKYLINKNGQKYDEYIAVYEKIGKAFLKSANVLKDIKEIRRLSSDGENYRNTGYKKDFPEQYKSMLAEKQKTAVINATVHVNESIYAIQNSIVSMALLDSAYFKPDGEFENSIKVCLSNSVVQDKLTSKDTGECTDPDPAERHMCDRKKADEARKKKLKEIDNCTMKNNKGEVSREISGLRVAIQNFAEALAWSLWLQKSISNGVIWEGLQNSNDIAGMNAIVNGIAEEKNEYVYSAINNLEDGLGEYTEYIKERIVNGVNYKTLENSIDSESPDIRVHLANRLVHEIGLSEEAGRIIKSVARKQKLGKKDLEKLINDEIRDVIERKIKPYELSLVSSVIEEDMQFMKKLYEALPRMYEAKKNNEPEKFLDYSRNVIKASIDYSTNKACSDKKGENERVMCALPQTIASAVLQSISYKKPKDGQGVYILNTTTAITPLVERLGYMEWGGTDKKDWCIDQWKKLENRELCLLGGNYNNGWYLHLVVGMGYARLKGNKDNPENKNIPLVAEQLGIGYKLATARERVSLKAGLYASGLLYRAAFDNEESDSVFVGSFVALELYKAVQLNASYLYSVNQNDTDSRKGYALGIYVNLTDYLKALAKKTGD